MPKAYSNDIRLRVFAAMQSGETCVKTNMAPLMGWGPKGERLPRSTPFGQWNTSTFIAALRHDRIDAPWVFDGPVNGEIFLTW